MHRFASSKLRTTKDFLSVQCSNKKQLYIVVSSLVKASVKYRQPLVVFTLVKKHQHKRRAKRTNENNINFTAYFYINFTIFNNHVV